MVPAHFAQPFLGLPKGFRSARTEVYERILIDLAWHAVGLEPVRRELDRVIGGSRVTDYRGDHLPLYGLEESLNNPRLVFDHRKEDYGHSLKERFKPPLCRSVWTPVSSYL